MNTDARKAKSIFRDEDGITTVSMAICIFISLALIFSSAQIYKLTSASSEVQDVADACALAAENEVAHFMLVAQTCDAAILSMTLLAGTTYGIGIVAACIPSAQGLSAKLIEAGTKIVKARDKFADKAASGLNMLQKLLPFLAAANAANLARSNNDGVMGANYFALALLVPMTGESLSVKDDDLAETGEEIEGSSDELQEAAGKAEEAAEEANESKLEAFMRDCGDNPGYCMYERASKLTGLSGSSNPLYTSVDTWSFSVALDRAKAYYSRRAKTETIKGNTVEEQADSVLRKRFYEYARDLLNSEGYVNEDGDSFSCNFPALFQGLDEFRETYLYTEKVYPVTTDEDSQTMHAWSGCPNAGSYVRLGSVSELENGDYSTCELCEFEIRSMASVADISTSATSGFEYHYKAVAEAAAKYSKAMSELEPLNDEVKSIAGGLFDSLEDVLSNIGGQRIEAHPPGEDGAIALVVNTSQNAADTGFESLFVNSGQTLGVRAAVSGAKLASDEVSDDGTVITTLLESFDVGSSGLLGAAQIMLDCWSFLLRAYQDGQSALTNAVEDGLNGFSQNTASGLGTWAAGALSSAIEACGLEPADLSIKKPVLVNTATVVEDDGGTLSVAYKKIKQGALVVSSPSTDLFSTLTSSLDSALSSLGISGNTITIATIEFPVGDVSIPITLSLPEQITGSDGLIQDGLDALGGAAGSISGSRSWQ